MPWPTDSLPWILFVAGLVGGAGHCVGMCGPLVAGYAITLRDRTATLPHLFFHLGRVTTYGFAGGIVGASGSFVRVAAWGIYQNFIDYSRLMLVGSSVGGTGVLLAAPRLADSLKAIITFGAAGAPVHSPDAMERIRKNCETLKIPMLLTSSEKDPFSGADSIRAWTKGLKHVGSKIIGGSEHGMAIYYEVRKDVLAFVKKNVAPTVRARPVRSR